MLHKYITDIKHKLLYVYVTSIYHTYNLTVFATRLRKHGNPMNIKIPTTVCMAV